MKILSWKWWGNVDNLSLLFLFLQEMEMYADPTSRGGVLEAEGIVSIKLRLKDQRPIMERLDPQMKNLVADLKNAPDSATKSKLETKIKARVEVLSPIYHQVAVQFADLHDTPSRMMAKGVIRYFLLLMLYVKVYN